MLKLLLLSLLSLTAHAEANRCQAPAKDEPVVYMNEFHWGQSQADMATNFDRLYNSGKRLFGRAYFNEATGGYEFVEPYGKVKIDPGFIAAVTKHVETSLQRGYAEHVFFPDMGHSHFYIPEKDWAPFAGENDRAKLYENFFKLRSLHILYHTAEQLAVRAGEHNDGDFPQDPVLLWRYFSRNVFGDNDQGDNVTVLFNGPKGYNSVSEVAGYHLYSAGFYISSSKDGCFPYKKDGKTYYFDIAIAEMPSDPNQGGDESAVKNPIAAEWISRRPSSLRNQ